MINDRTIIIQYIDIIIPDYIHGNVFYSWLLHVTPNIQTSFYRNSLERKVGKPFVGIFSLAHSLVLQTFVA